MAETGMGQSRIAKLAGVQQSTISLFLAEKTDGSSAFRTSIWDVISQDHGMDRR
jgi:predicted transcriptional regulator